MGGMTFALYFGNRDFFPETLIGAARQELREAVERQGYNALMLDEGLTRYGAIESVEDGKKYGAFLKAMRGKYDGVILCLPNFGNETAAVAALRECGVPILIQAYPDEFGRYDFKHRRDAFCGKISIMDVFYQHKIAFTSFKPHTVSPSSEAFVRQLEWFASICRIANRMKSFTVGAIGARTTAFKTVRFDELSLQRYGITTETLDLSELFKRVREIKAEGHEYEAKTSALKQFTNWDGVPDEKVSMLAKVGIAIDDLIREYELDAIALRCWIEMEKELKVAPCVLLGELNERGIAAACEVDVCNAIPMFALSLASQKPSMCLDWNNNYGEEENKCIIFHCGPVANSLMTEKGHVIDHPMFAKTCGAGCGWGPNVGRIAASPITYASSKTEEGKLVFYVDEGRFTDDPIEEGFFGCGGVVEIERLQDKLLSIGKKGFRHHVSVTPGHVAVPMREAFSTYLKYELTQIGGC